VSLSGAWEVSGWRTRIIADHLTGDHSNTREEPANHSCELAAFSAEGYDTDQLNFQEYDCLPQEKAFDLKYLVKSKSEVWDLYKGRTVREQASQA
jgi:hypothetical protein